MAVRTCFSSHQRLAVNRWRPGVRRRYAGLRLRAGCRVRTCALEIPDRRHRDGATDHLSVRGQTVHCHSSGAVVNILRAALAARARYYLGLCKPLPPGSVKTTMKTRVALALL